MVGSGLRKLGDENGLRVLSDSVCGNFKGYFVRMNEGASTKKIDFCFNAEDSEKQLQINAFIDDVQKKNQINTYSHTPTGMTIVFADTVGTISRIKEFLDKFIPFLDSLEIKGANYCSVCGKILDSPPEFQFHGDITYYGHRSCIQNDSQRASTLLAEGNKSYVKGIIGALLGMFIGVIPMILLAQVSIYSGIAGLLLGTLIKKGYEILGGKLGRSKLAIILIFAVVGVFLATYCNCAIATYGFYMEANYLPTFTEFIQSTFEIMFAPENQSILSSELGLGFLFTGLGFIRVYKQVNNEIRKQDSQAKSYSM